MLERHSDNRPINQRVEFGYRGEHSASEKSGCARERIHWTDRYRSVGWPMNCPREDNSGSSQSSLGDSEDIIRFATRVYSATLLTRRSSLGDARLTRRPLDLALDLALDCLDFTRTNGHSDELPNSDPNTATGVCEIALAFLAHGLVAREALRTGAAGRLARPGWPRANSSSTLDSSRTQKFIAIYGCDLLA